MQRNWCIFDIRLRMVQQKGVTEGLSRSSDSYSEAIESLKARYDCSELTHQTHVRMIIEATPHRDGTGKELRRLYDVVQQHLQALKAMKYQPSGSFITSMLELKLDINTMFEWQKYSQDSVDVPHYQRLLEFNNLRAQASEASVSDQKRASRVEDHSVKKGSNAGKSITLFTASTVNSTSHNCVICKSYKHPLFACLQFKSLPHDEVVSTLMLTFRTKMDGLP